MGNIVLYSVPVLLVVVAVELSWARARGTALHRFVDTITNFNVGATGLLFSLVSTFVSGGVFTLVHERFALLELPHTPWTFALCLVLYDFLYYWTHRWSHTMNLWWGAHVVHHSSGEYNLSVSFRQSWIHHLIAFPVFLPLAILGFDLVIASTVAAVATIHQFWIHTKAVDRLPRWIELVINCPTHHRVHHAVNPRYIDKNYGALLIVWDRLLGTFEEEVEEPRYGITQPLVSSNPLWINTHVYAELWANMRAASSAWAALRLLVASPGALEAPGRPARARRTARPASPGRALRIYVLGQSILSTAAVMTFVVGVDGLGLGARLWIAALVVWATASHGALLDGKAWAWRGEQLRLFCVTATLGGLGVVHLAGEPTLVLVGVAAVGLVLLTGFASVIARDPAGARMAASRGAWSSVRRLVEHGTAKASESMIFALDELCDPSASRSTCCSQTLVGYRSPGASHAG